MVIKEVRRKVEEKMKKKIAALLAMAILVVSLVGCSDMEYVADGDAADQAVQMEVQKGLATNQQTPTDIDYSLERYNLIRRAYWVNGQREKANTLICEIEKPLGYIVLLTEGGGVVGSFVVDGKVSSLNSFLSPDSEYYSLEYGGTYTKENRWLADVDGSYGENDNGIFFFTPDGKYIEWTGIYLYSDIPFEVEEPVIKVAQ